MITGGIMLGANRPWNIMYGSNPVLDIFYKNASSFQSIFTHWTQVSKQAWSDIGVYTWNQDLYAHEQTEEELLQDNVNYIGNFVMGTGFLG